MANENNVVRLKHLQPLVSGVANDFSIQNGDNAVRLKHLVSLATALDNDKQTPVLSLGSWSSADTVYSAPITYTGDGTLSTDIGTISNDILTVADEDGNFNGVISAAEGDNFNQTYLTFNYNTCTITNTVTVQGGEDRLQKILNGCTDYELAGSSSVTLNYGETKIVGVMESVEGSYLDYNAVLENGDSAFGVASKRKSDLTKDFDIKLMKLNEYTGLAYVSEKLKNGDYHYDGEKSLREYHIKDENFQTFYSEEKVSLCAAVSSVASSMESSNVTFCRSIFNGNDLLVFTEKRTGGFQRQEFSHLFFPEAGSAKRAYVNVNGQTLSGIIYDESSPPYELKKAWNVKYTHSDDKIIVQKGDKSRLTPIIVNNNPNDLSYINLGSVGYADLNNKTYNSFSGFWLNYTNPFLNQEGETSEKILLGVWPDKANSSCYIVTFKEGTYNADTWLADCFTVWGLCRCRNMSQWKIKYTGLKITDIVDDILL